MFKIDCTWIGVVYSGDHMVGIGTVKNTWILTAFLFWKDSYLFRNLHSNLVILTPLYCTHVIQIKPELRLLLYSHRQLNFPNRRPTLLRIMMPTSTLPTLSAIWMSQSNRDWGGYVMDIVYMTHILLIHFITTRTFDIESLYHSTYFLTYPLQTFTWTPSWNGKHT